MRCAKSWCWKRPRGPGRGSRRRTEPGRSLRSRRYLGAEFASSVGLIPTRRCATPGYRSWMTCPVCGTRNPDHARFCLRCGSALTGRTTEGERRIVTMLFCDVVGSTAMAERLDPEAWTEVMNEVFEVLIAPIHRYEGTLARLMGDAIFAFFGAPTAHEDDPVRAVRAGLEIVEAIEGHRAELELDLNVRVGINTGPVVVGEVGSERSIEYTAMGDAVNVAARMEQTAEPGTVRITEDTARLVDDWFELGPGTSTEV